MDNNPTFLNACRNGQTGIMKIFLQKGGIDVNKRDAQGNTPLWYACGKGYREIAGLLLANGVDATLPNNQSETPLHALAQSGNKEIAAASADPQGTSHHYDILLKENRRLTLNDQAHILALEKAEAREQDYHPGLSNKKLLLPLTKDYLAHALAALTAGYALGKSEKYLRNLLLSPLAEAAMKRYEYRKIRETDLLPVLSAFVLLHLDPKDFKKFDDKLKESGVRDFVTDTLVHSRLLHWEITELTVFPEWKALLTGSDQPGVTPETEPETAPEDSGLLIRDVILKIIHTS